MGIGYDPEYSNIAALARAERMKERSEAHDTLARILSEEFGVEIKGEQVLDLIRKRWRRVQLLAHYVHDLVSA